MADITVKGYVNKPVAKKAASGKEYSQFTLAEQVKDRDGNKSTVYYNVTDFEHKTPPAESSFGTVGGWLKVRSYESQGQKRQSLDIVAKSLDIAPPRAANPLSLDILPLAKEPWED